MSILALVVGGWAVVYSILCPQTRSEVDFSRAQLLLAIAILIALDSIAIALGLTGDVLAITGLLAACATALIHRTRHPIAASAVRPSTTSSEQPTHQHS